MSNLLSNSSAHFSDIANQAFTESAIFTALPQWRIIDIQGEEAASFLHNQLTQDVTHLEANKARLGGLCSIKGRLIATLFYWRFQNNETRGIRCMIASDIANIIQKRLSMYVLRSKAKIILNDEIKIMGFAGEEKTLNKKLTVLLESPLPQHGNEIVFTPFGTLIKKNNILNIARYFFISTSSFLSEQQKIIKADWGVKTSALWDWLNIHSGEPSITAATQDCFVPQMINYELIDGVSFQKGCYPGQEIVARSQYRGTIKRRAVLAHSIVTIENIQVGNEIFSDNDPLQPTGKIINVAENPAGGVDCLVEVKLTALNAQKIFIKEIDGPLLSLFKPPYDVPEFNLMPKGLL